MKLVNYQEIVEKKILEQKSIKELEYHASGHCVHIGKISPGCRRCFTNEQGCGIQIGSKCMFNCSCCYYDRERKEEHINSINNKISDFYYQYLSKNYKPLIISYQSTGETLLYIEYLEKFSDILKKNQEQHNINTYYFIYTNGILATKENLKRLKNMGVHEIRFHWSASNFSEQVLNNMEEASKMGFYLTLEEPSLPKNEEKLLNLLPILDKLNFSHLDIVEVQLTPYNINDLKKEYNDDNYLAYKDYFYHLYDNNLVYNLIKETINKKYKFSIIDCSSAVERCRHNKDQNILFDFNSIKNMCKDWNYHGKSNIK